LTQLAAVRRALLADVGSVVLHAQRFPGLLLTLDVAVDLTVI